jgi:hypothetical protein
MPKRPQSLNNTLFNFKIKIEAASEMLFNPSPFGNLTMLRENNLMATKSFSLII